MKVDDIIDKYKTRLVVKRFRQQEGIDYFDTYLLISRITFIQILIAILAIKKHEIHQMGVKTTLLNGDLKDEVYMEQPKGFVVDEQDG
jgi:hypothetical protein